MDASAGRRVATPCRLRLLFKTHPAEDRFETHPRDRFFGGQRFFGGIPQSGCLLCGGVLALPGAWAHPAVDRSSGCQFKAHPAVDRLGIALFGRNVFFSDGEALHFVPLGQKTNKGGQKGSRRPLRPWLPGSTRLALSLHHPLGALAPIQRLAAFVGCA